MTFPGCIEFDLEVISFLGPARCPICKQPVHSFQRVSWRSKTREEGYQSGLNKSTIQQLVNRHFSKVYVVNIINHQLSIILISLVSNDSYQFATRSSFFALSKSLIFPKKAYLIIFIRIWCWLETRNQLETFTRTA